MFLISFAFDCGEELPPILGLSFGIAPLAGIKALLIS